MPYLPLLTALAFVLSPLVVGGFGGFDPGDFPIPQDDPPIQPAGWAFAIWGVIYIWLVVHAGFGAVKRREAPDWQPTRLPLSISLAIGAIWIPVANVSPLWATALILVMLGTAVVALLRAGPRDRWLLAVPLGLYAGWLTAASAVSLGLVVAGYGAMPQTNAALLALVLVLVVALPVMIQRRTVAYQAALVWALMAIGVRGLDPLTSVAALAFIMAGGIVIVTMMKRRS